MNKPINKLTACLKGSYKSYIIVSSLDTQPHDVDEIFTQYVCHIFIMSFRNNFEKTAKFDCIMILTIIL